MGRKMVIGIILVAGLALAALLLAGQMGRHHGAMKRGEGPMIRTALADKGDPKAGKAIYERFCLTCHGASGRGDGPTGRLLTPKPSDFVKRLPHHGENWAGHYFKIIKEGGRAVGRSPIMAPWGSQLKDDEIWDVISYIQILANGS